MKFLFYIACIAAAGWAGWQFHPNIVKEMQARIDERKAEEAKESASTASNAQRPGGNSGKPGDLLAQLRTPQLNGGDTGKPTLLPNTGSAPPSNPGTVARPEPPKPAVDEIDARYPMPTFKSIEEITKEWSAIPSRAFPKKIKTKVPLTFDAPAGKVELPAGSDATAGGMVAGMLIVMREGDQSSRIQVPLANTDLKENLTSLYEKYKDYRRNLVMKQREHARALKARSNGASEDQMKLAGPKPEVRPGGVIPIMLASIEALKLTELKASSITAWGALDFEEVDGTVYWTGTVQCTVENPLFGPQPTEVMALMKDNKVVKWIYTGSREPVQ